MKRVSYRLAVAGLCVVSACATDGATDGEDDVDLASLSQAAESDYKRTVVFVRGETQPGQDMFIRGGVDHDISLRDRGILCTPDNFRCAIPIRHRNHRSATTEPWKHGDAYLDWYGRELLQTGVSSGIQAAGSAADWTTSLWPRSFGAARTVAQDGFGLEPMQQLGLHQWMLDVDMDCSAAYFPSTRNQQSPFFEVKSFISGGPGWEPDVVNQGWAAWSRNHVAQCGAINIFERGSHRSRVIPFPIAVASGAVRLMAGSYGSSGSNDSTGTFARFNGPGGIAADGNGYVYVADTWNHKIRRIRWNNAAVTSYIGSGMSGSVDGPGASARLNQPFGLATDQNGTLFVADRENHQIRRIVLPVAPFPGTDEGVPSIALFAGAPSAASVKWGDQDGVGTGARFRDPSGMAVDGDGNLYVADRGNAKIRRIVLATGEVTTLAGSGSWGSADGVGAAAQFAGPEGVAFDGRGALYVADTGNHTIRRIDLATRQVTTVAGAAGSSGSVDGVASGARFDAPINLVSDMGGRVFLTDSGSGRVRVLETATGQVSTRASGLRQPYGITRDGLGHLYVTEASGPTVTMIGE